MWFLSYKLKGVQLIEFHCHNETFHSNLFIWEHVISINMSIINRNRIDPETSFFLQEGTQTNWNKTRAFIIYLIKKCIPNHISRTVLNDYLLKFVTNLFCVCQFRWS